jgi:hypothetical protein
METEGTVVEDYALAENNSNPDFWVLTKDGREWLLECKNIAQHTYNAGNKYSRVLRRNTVYDHNNVEWSHNLNWTHAQILEKNWKSPHYQARGTSGHPSKVPIISQNASPVLVISRVDIFDGDSIIAILEMFHKNIVVAGGQVAWGKGVEKPFKTVLDRLAEVFTRN